MGFGWSSQLPLAHAGSQRQMLTAASAFGTLGPCMTERQMLTRPKGHVGSARSPGLPPSNNHARPGLRACGRTGGEQAGVYKVADDVKNEYVALYRFSRCVCVPRSRRPTSLTPRP